MLVGIEVRELYTCVLQRAKLRGCFALDLFRRDLSSLRRNPESTDRSPKFFSAIKQGSNIRWFRNWNSIDQR